MTDREAVWFALHEALPPGWRVGAATFDPATELSGVTARSPKPPGRRRPPEVFEQGQGATGAVVDWLGRPACHLRERRPVGREAVVQIAEGVDLDR